MRLQPADKYVVACHRVKTYEAKLAALNAVNSALQKENEQLREDLEDAMQPKTDAGNAGYMQSAAMHGRFSGSWSYFQQLQVMLYCPGGRLLKQESLLIFRP